MQIFHPRAIGSGPVPEAKFRAKIRSNENKMTERDVVSNYPWCDTNDEDQGSGGGVRQEIFSPPEGVIPNPQSRRGKKSQKGSVR
jgi:hypothetical protein